MDDVVREIAAITPGPYFHMGGDENPILSRPDYTKFVERTQDIVARHGKQLVGWEEIARARLKPTTIAQAWATDTVAAAAVKYGAKVILSPGKRTYLDMKYDANTELGLKWAALIEVRDAYDWDPATYMKGVTESNIAGVEARDLGGDGAEHHGCGVSGDAAAARARRGRVDAAERAKLGWLQHPARDACAKMEFSRRELLSIASNPLGFPVRRGADQS